MKKIISGILVVAVTLSTIAVKAQTADDIVNKYFDAIGGKDKIKQVNSVYMEGVVQVMGNESPTTITILNGKGYKTESDFGGQKAIQCYTDKGGWAVNPMAGGAAEAMPAEIYNAGKDQIDIGGGLLDYATKGNTIELQGKEGGAYKIKLTTKDKVETTFFIDASTYYLTKAVKKGNMMGQEVEITVKFSEYKKTDIGYFLPNTIDMELGQFALSTSIKKIEINKTIDPAVFVMPK